MVGPLRRHDGHHAKIVARNEVATVSLGKR
jgi:hypothetical protein